MDELILLLLLMVPDGLTLSLTKYSTGHAFGITSTM